MQSKQKLFSYASPYRSTSNIPTSLSIRKYPVYSNTPDSPRSTRSAPWSRSHQKGLFGVNSSPRSVRSASSRKNVSIPTHRMRSSSVESHSSNESKACKRYVLKAKMHSSYHFYRLNSINARSLPLQATKQKSPYFRQRK